VPVESSINHLPFSQPLMRIHGEILSIFSGEEVDLFTFHLFLSRRRPQQLLCCTLFFMLSSALRSCFYSVCLLLLPPPFEPSVAQLPFGPPNSAAFGSASAIASSSSPSRQVPCHPRVRYLAFWRLPLRRPLTLDRQRDSNKTVRGRDVGR
jgi:hypothetical protein